jgi:hypothetical protein
MDPSLEVSAVSHRRSRITVALLCSFALAGCKQPSTAPTTPPPTTRTVAVTVEDSTGARVPGAVVSGFGLSDATTITQISPRPTDAAGVASFSLVEGPWCMYTRVERYNASVLVAGSTGTVGPRPAPDTVLYRLVLRTQSIARGKLTLSGQTAHDGTLVSVLGVLPAFSQTAADGAYELDGFPPGSWSAFADHQGFQSARFTIVVPAPADTVDAGTIALRPAPAIARP